MKNEDKEFKKTLKQNYPKEPDSFRNMVKTKITEQLGKDKAEQICKNKKKHKTQNSMFSKNLKWVAVFALILVSGTTAVAATNPELIDYLLQILKSEDVYSYMQEVNPNVKEKSEDLVLENELLDVKLSLDKPLWKIVNAWYDGTTIYFSATPDEEAIKMAELYHMNPSDHCKVNGIDYMLDCNDADYSEGNLSKGEKSGQYHFKIDVAKQDFSGLVDISFNLYIQARDEEVSGYTTQEIAFQVSDTGAVIKTVKEEEREVLLDDGISKAKILVLKLSPSTMYAKVQYIISGENAKEQAEELRGKETIGACYVMDSFGNQTNGIFPDPAESGIIKKEVDGSYSVTFEWQTDDIDPATDSLTFLPFSMHLRADGKDESITMLNWAKFNVSVE